MSSLIDRSSWRPSLEQRLKVAGIHVPDQARVRRTMEAMRLGLKPTASEWRMALAWLRRYNRAWVAFKIFSYDEFVGSWFTSYGGHPPRRAADIAAHVQAACPGVSLTVHALFDDPWLAATDMSGETLFLAGWYRECPAAHTKMITL